MTPAELEVFKLDAAEKRAEWEARRNKAAQRVRDYYTTRYGEGVVK